MHKPGTLQKIQFVIIQFANFRFDGGDILGDGGDRDLLGDGCHLLGYGVDLLGDGGDLPGDGGHILGDGGKIGGKISRKCVTFQPTSDMRRC